MQFYDQYTSKPFWLKIWECYTQDQRDIEFWTTTSQYRRTVINHLTDCVHAVYVCELISDRKIINNVNSNLYNNYNHKQNGFSD